ncbi:MAG: GHKL domain-containing protein [Acholeplasmataceae bacterium]|nr:GHKL domain-containing protein [Acholeplasmataceae bacterium]
MKKAIIRNNMLLLLSALTLFFVIAFISLYQIEKKHQTSLMSFLIDEVETSYVNFDESDFEFVQQFSQNDRRITILDANGFVLADTHDDAVGKDKSQRPEILDLGSIQSRKSDTIGVELLYIAKQLDNDMYIRVSIPYESQISTYNQSIWIFIISSIIISIVYYIGLKKVNSNLLKPWDKVKDGLSLLNQGKYQMMSLNSNYPEINDILHEMNQINYDTSLNLIHIKNYQKQSNEILNEIKQVILLFDHEKNLIFYNSKAKDLFDLNEDLLNKNSYNFIRDHELENAIDKTIDFDQLFHKDIKINNQYYDTFVLPLHTESSSNEFAKVLVTLKDVTEDRQLGQMKKDFISHASHELKSPLAAIRGYAELIQLDMLKKQEEVKNVSGKIVEQTKFMNALVEDMLMLSRLENIKEEHFQDIELSSICSKVITGLKQVYKDKHIKLIFDKEALIYHADPIDFAKLFKNLIENAYKYSPQKSVIKVSLTKTEDQKVCFSVSDQGIGIDKEQQSRIFERFYRVDKGRLEGGTGLGLAIVKHIVIKYNGEIKLTSALQKGTEIKVIL